MGLLTRFFGSKDEKKNLAASIVPSSLQRVRQDIISWRTAVAEAEQAYFPFRVKMQKLFVDTVLNGHVTACMEFRKNLTLQRDYRIMQGEVANEDLQKLLNVAWFDNLLSYVLDAQYYGYSLISLGDVTNSSFENMALIRRENVSPDRMIVSPFDYAMIGKSFVEPPYAKWHIYADTPSENGHSKCGYGLLYKVAMYEIICRNLIGYNSDAAELFGMPLRVGKTTKTEEAERKDFADALQYMGSAGWAVIDLQDEIELIANSTGATGFQIYADLEKRCEAKISKIILGHADAMDSTPGKLGGGNENGPAQKAIDTIQNKDGKFTENIINNQIFPKLREIGFMIPEDAVFQFSNDKEAEDYRAKVDNSNKVTADIALTMSQAGLKMAPEYFEERTGIPTTEAPKPKEVKSIQNKLNELYR